MYLKDLLSLVGIIEFLNSPIKEISTGKYITICVLCFAFGYVVRIIRNEIKKNHKNRKR